MGYRIESEIQGGPEGRQWYVGLEVDFSGDGGQCYRTYTFPQPVPTERLQLAYATDDRSPAILFWAWSTDYHLFVPIICKGRTHHVLELSVPPQDVTTIHVAVHGAYAGRLELQLIGRRAGLL